MSQPRSVSRLSRIGFEQAGRAGELLTGIGLWRPEPNEPADDAAAAVVSAIGRAADPDLALRMLAELVAAEPRVLARLRSSPEFRARLLGVLGASQALADHLVLHPSDALALAEPYDLAGAGDRIQAAVEADPADPVTGTGG